MGKGRKVNKAKPSVSIPISARSKSSASASSAGSSPISPVTPKTPADEGIEFFQSPLAPGEAPLRVYELRLDIDGGPHKDRSYIRLPPAYVPYILRVSIDAGTPASMNGVFKTNFPLDGGKFNRARFTERKLPSDFSKPIQIDLPISHAGAFVFWVEYDGELPSQRIKGREGYFNVDPVLRIKGRSPILSSELSPLPPSSGTVLQKDTVNLPLDGLSILTVVSKWMGPMSEWKNHFAEAKDRGYTMLHYTPLQERGESDSPYSIRDQLKYDPSMFDGKRQADGGKEKVEAILKVAREEYGLLSLTDVVLNHTANDSPWLVDHPESGFSPANSPHLTPALELDSAMIEFSSSPASRGLPSIVNTQQDVDALIGAFRTVMKDLNLWQYYVLDVAREKESIKAVLASKKTSPWTGPSVAGKSVVELTEVLRGSNVIIGLAELSSRFGVHSDANAASGFIQAAFVELSDPDALADAWVRVLDVINVPLYQEWEEDTKIAMDNIKNRLTYARLDENGPKLGEITKANPLVETYFTRCGPKPDSDPLVYSLANNGWIWAADPLQNFALLPSKAYLRREVIVWGDCVKLRYGSGPEDNPWLWSHITSYVTSLAATFDGFRIDNCHSTPLHVGVSMLDAARVVKPDLYVCAELFTGSEEMDLLFVKRLGINSLIRESYNGWDAKEYSRLLYRHGVGKPVGSMDEACLTSTEEIPSPTGKGPLRKAVVTPLNGSMPHALLYDLTHDNESPLHKRSAEDALSTGALVTFSYSAIGSVKGFDDLYPKLLNLVGEKRKYEVTGLEEDSGIARVKRVLNSLHLEMVLGGYEEGHVHQENDYIVSSRVQPGTQKGYLLVAHTGFAKNTKDRGYISPIKLRRTRAKFIMGASIDITSYNVSADAKTLKGLPHKLVEMSPVVVPQGLDDESPYSEIIVPEYFPPGSIMLFETHLQDHDASLEEFVVSNSQEIFGNLGLVELNVVLYRADGEERDATNGQFGVYDVPGLGRLTYCGLEGWMHPLRHIMRHNDLGHPLCEHLRKGTWSLDYVYDPDDLPNLKNVAQWFKDRFDRIKATAPPFLRPKYFALVLSEAYKAARHSVVEQCSEFVLTGHDFTQDLALCAIQMYGLVKSASLDPSKPTPSLAAGLPHFAAGWARCWGRDVFISLRGLFLTTGNFEGARKHILAFASTLKHGLIPNLLDSVRKPRQVRHYLDVFIITDCRYNSRDSPWWMVQNIQDYVKMAPDGLALLSEVVPRRFPKDETWVEWDDKRAYAYSSTLAEIIQEILQRHAMGIHFREYNAGPNLDMQMRDEGFNIDIDVDWKTGLIFGGNAFNCGTWMDKMGESQKAGTKGQPGTPRDGAPVEITGLVKSALTWLDGLSSKGKFPFKGVQAIVDGKERLVTYKEWADLIQASFEKCYYVPLDAAEDTKYNLDSKLVNRRGIYKDVYGSGEGREWSDYQFRPNFPIAMTVAPELFDSQHGLHALQLADKVLRSPLGMKTLDPSDMQYRPIYDNSNDSTDAAIAKGLNYHNGPEWGWPLGFFLRAYLDFDTRVGAGKKDIKVTLHRLHQALLIPREHLQNDPWAGIPELTNADGQHCSDSCNTQAWSASTLLDFLETVHEVNAKVAK
ncbi:glycoside hydrolase family 13 protein [Lentinula lateritia]|nr:glycoside hydrolase family 13 protein [Lentinula lateritia]